MKKGCVGMIALFFVLLFSAGVASSENLSFSSWSDFSSVQGQGGWWYLDGQGNQLVFDSSRQWWRTLDTADSYRLIWAWGAHPGTNADVVRRWIAPKSGRARITGVVSDADAGGGDGVIVSIRQGGSVLLWEQKIPNGALSYISFAVTTGIVAGDYLDFTVNAGTAHDNRWDSTVFVASIELEVGDTHVLTPEQDTVRYIIVDVQDQGAEPRGPCTTFGVEEMVRTIALREGAGSKLGFAGLIALWNMSDENMRSCLQTFFQTAEKFDLPLFIRLDSEHFWNDRPDMWNWFDPAQWGYNPANKDNVEWSWWDTPTTKSYINWGQVITRAPRPCFESAAVREELKRKLNIVAEEVNAWRKHLLVEGRRYLFAGVDTGWETGIDSYAGVSWVPFEDQVSHGYCSLSKRGFGADNPPADRDLELARIVHDFAEFQTRILVEAGIPRSRIITHTWGCEGICGAWRMHAPLWTSDNATSRIGLSLYQSVYNYSAVAALVSGREWALVETGTAPEHYMPLLALNPKLVVLYNWENGASGSLRDNPYYLWALQFLFTEQ